MNEYLKEMTYQMRSMAKEFMSELRKQGPEHIRGDFDVMYFIHIMLLLETGQNSEEGFLRLDHEMISSMYNVIKETYEEPENAQNYN